MDWEPFIVIEFQFVKPGKGTAFTRTKVRNLINGAVIDRTFKSGEKLKPADTEERPMQYLYSDGNYHFLDSSNYEQVSLENTIVGENDNYLTENTKLISNKKNIVRTIKDKCNHENFAITDISHSRAVIQIKGLQSKEVLKKGCPININEIQVNNCAGTVFNGITVVVDFVNNNPDTFNLLALRSFGETFYHHITDAALEFGYAGVWNL